MKKIFSIIGLTFMVIGFSACSDWLDLRPESEIVLDDFWQDESEVNQVVAACYRSLTENGVMERMMTWGELRSDNVVKGTLQDMPTSMFRLIDGDLSINNEYAKWGPFYTVINYCNTFLHYAPEVVERDANFTESKFNSLKAEVLTLRALSYFYLVRTFKEVPWIDAPSIADNQDYQIPKSSETFVLNKLLEDLTFAERYSRDQFETELLSKARITKSAVRSLMADIYMWMEDYEAAVAYCDKVMANTDLELVEGEEMLYEVFFNKNASESIFELQFERDIKENDLVRANYGSYDRTVGFWTFPLALVTGNENFKIFNVQVGTTYESEEDLRRKDFLYSTSVAQDFFSIFKYVGARRIEMEDGSSAYVFGSHVPNWIVYRLSDIILLRAEALVQLNRLEEAMEMVNLTYMRSNIEEGTLELNLDFYNSQGQMTNLVLRERQRELMFEGKRWFDLMRLARREDSPVSLVGYVVKKYAGGSNNLKLSVMDALYMPIHIDEFNSNSALEQNPYYEIEDGNITK
ncbi:RagB/SusD family nutrient uptake outer membrane protein [Geofilum rubicundum]|uniref:Outer membrane protein n=1 Tax=Geofilum rubicundum JCM 15548 TaxID=1236989 RepID=A0A0E9LZ11_9BACT|nr:RagB/SusD family nutrient uptake outer membrane protein [Geofilum rubicundum]GAO30832.1 outer membrane protein [Geofilum rubicundum JCM 15548]